jgi:hypothetical protein
MHIDVSEDDYNDAINKALEIIGPRPQSAGAQALSILLASVYDYTGIDGNVFECLAVLDTPIRQIGFCLVMGRTMYHRPIYQLGNGQTKRCAARRYATENGVCLLARTRR